MLCVAKVEESPHQLIEIFAPQLPLQSHSTIFRGLCKELRGGFFFGNQRVSGAVGILPYPSAPGARTLGQGRIDYGYANLQTTSIYLLPMAGILYQGY